MRPDRLTVRDVAEATGIPPADWIADCFGISLAIVDSGLVEGTPAFGLYTGPVHPASPWIPPRDWLHWTWGMQVVLPPVQREPPPFVAYDQGHVRLADGRVLDATRWTYEMVPPYLYVGTAHDYAPVPPDEQATIDEYVGHLRDELAAGERSPYRGGLRFCRHDDEQRQAAAALLPSALQDPWFRPLFDLAARAEAAA